MPGDSFFSEVQVALHMEGSSGGTSFIDSSNMGQTITPSGATTSTIQVKFGSTSGLFTGSGSQLTIPYLASHEASNKYVTLTGWFWFDPANSDFGLFKRGRLAFGYRAATSGGRLVLLYTIGGVGKEADADGLGDLRGTWHYLEIGRDPTTGVWYVFIDGVSKTVTGTQTAGTIDSFSESMQIGNDNNLVNFKGYIDDFLYTVSATAVRHTASYTPPVAAFPDYAYRFQGTVEDSSGTLVARTLHCHKRSTGELIDYTTSSAADGTFTLYTHDNSQHYITALDSGSENALVFDLLTPV